MAFYGRKNKYDNRKTVVDGITFHSGAEARRYQILKLLERAGEIEDLELQPKFTVFDGFRKKGKKHQAITYTADFKYKEVKTGEIVIEDVKGVETEVFKIKKKLFEKRYPDLEITIIKE